MANYCTYVPNKGKKLFNDLKSNFGYDIAKNVFLRAYDPKFKEDYKKILVLDEEGAPTFDSLMKTSYMQEFIGEKQMINSISKRYPPEEDTLENYSALLESAQAFNTKDSMNNKFTATVERNDDGKLHVKIQPKTQEAFKKFQEQYAAQKLNEKLASIFKPLGVTIGMLNRAETEAGRIGVTDFSKARDIANGFTSLIKIANNFEGAKALTEEFGHLIVGIFRNDPLMQRALNTLKNDENAVMKILGEDYQDVYNFYNGDEDLIAEEALGHVLKQNLLKNGNEVETPSKSLFKRLVDWIINKFKKYSADDVYNAIDDVDGIMDSLAKDILQGSRQITQEDIKNAQRDVQFNALSDRIERNIDILKKAKDVEVKRYKITKNESSKEATKDLISELKDYSKEDADTAEGILKYAKHALSELKHIEHSFGSLDEMTPEQKFKFLRSAKMYVQSYAGFLEDMNNALIDEDAEDDNMFLKGIEIDGVEVNVKDIIKELNDMSKRMLTRYNKVAIPMFVEFLKPFIGDEIVIPFGKYAGTKMAVEDLIKEAPNDISLTDMWLDSMSNSSDVVLQGYGLIVKDAKGRARLKSIDNIKQIQLFRQQVEDLGITNFSWMFEKDADGNKTGNYISEVNYGQFEKDLKNLETELEEKYGKNPTGEKALEKIAARKEWYKTHALSPFGKPLPNPSVYRNKAYDELTSDQKTVLSNFLSIKSRFDSKLPSDKVDTLKAIQIRRSGGERLFDSLSSPSSIYENIKESVKNTFIEREDDDSMFGEKAVERGLTDFSGNEFMTLPALYTHKLSNPNELSEDVMGSLMAYAYSANQFEEMSKVIDVLEIGYDILTNNRKVRKTRGGKPIEEKTSALGEEATSDAYVTESNINRKLKDFRESQIYGRYMKDEGTFLGDKLSVSKTTNWVLRMASLGQLGFNWLANMANVATGLGMQNIEAASGQFFSIKELAKADKEYASLMPSFMAELPNRVKTNKLALFYELFDIKQDAGRKAKQMQKKNLLLRIFGADIAFMGQEAGDHWLYGRTGIAMALREKVLKDGEEMSLWDALQVEDVKAGSDVKKLSLKGITTLDGKPFDVTKFSEKVKKINHTCFGIYNEDDSNAANRVAIGRLLQQYRKWMKPALNRRFQAGHMDLATGVYEEGYHRTMGRILAQLIRGKVQLGSVWDTLTDDEKFNIKRSIFEMAQFFAVWALANLIEWPDDKDRPWAMKLAEYSARRLSHELGTLAPSPIMIEEMLKTVKSPVPSITAVNNLINLGLSAVNPMDHMDEIKSGPYKGLSTVEKNFIKAPLPIVAQYRQIDKFVGDLDNSIFYYARPLSY